MQGGGLMFGKPRNYMGCNGLANIRLNPITRRRFLGEEVDSEAHTCFRGWPRPCKKYRLFTLLSSVQVHQRCPIDDVADSIFPIGVCTLLRLLVNSSVAGAVLKVFTSQRNGRRSGATRPSRTGLLIARLTSASGAGLAVSSVAVSLPPARLTSNPPLLARS
jgi:hypothetical protein